MDINSLQPILPIAGAAVLILGLGVCLAQAGLVTELPLSGYQLAPMVPQWAVPPSAAHTTVGTGPIGCSCCSFLSSWCTGWSPISSSSHCAS